MIKLIVFDLDGVLVDARDLHYHALNDALVACGYPFIGRDEHLAKFDGRTTTAKLKMLVEANRIRSEDIDKIWKAKQDATVGAIQKHIKPNPYLQDLLSELCVGVQVHCASNSIGSTVDAMLKALGISQYFHDTFSNEDVDYPKPHSQIYLKCMVVAGVNPRETLIVEDSHLGRKAAFESGAHVLGVLSPADVTLENVVGRMKEINNREVNIRVEPKWQGGKMNVLIPMAGAGSRFEQAGYTFPKPLIDVEGKPMIQVVTENLNVDATHIYIVQKEHYDKYNLSHVLRLISGNNCRIVVTEGITEGAACTTLLASEYIDNDNPLLIANSDQFVEWNSNEFLYAMQSEGVDAGILTFKSVHPKWSYARLDKDGFVCEVAEKKPISDIATVGIYYWNKGSDYVKYAKQMIYEGIRVNNEFYVCPVFNQAIKDGKKIKIFSVPKMWGLGTPEDLQVFLGRNK